MKAGVAIDAWKMPIFARHLAKAGYTYKDPVRMAPDTLLLTVETDDGLALSKVLRAAMIEAAEVKGAQS